MQEDSDFLKELFTHVSKKIAKPYAALASMEEELRKNWYDSPESINSITDQQFQKMNIPLRVATAIREEISGLICKSPKQSQPPSDNKTSVLSEKPEKKSQNPSQSQLNEGNIMLIVQKLQNKLLQKYPWVGQQLLKILQTLYKIIKNIIGDSYELKFRVLKKSNPRIKQVVLNNPPVLTFLKDIGFEEDQETIFLDTFDTQAYFFVEECLEACLQNHKKQNAEQSKAIQKVIGKKQEPVEKYFLPQDLQWPGSQSVDLKGAFPKQSLDEANYAEMLDKLIAFRKKIMSTAPKDRKVKIYHKRFDVREVPHIVIDMEKELQHENNTIIANYWKNIIKNNQKNTHFQSRRKAEFEFLLSQQVYRETTIKLRLPNELIIQAHFGPLQTLKDVHTLVADIVIGQFYLYQAPPVKMLDKQMHKTLDSLESVPCGHFYIGLKTEWYIKNEYFKHIRS